jgi:hypothetical protein
LLALHFLPPSPPLLLFLLLLLPLLLPLVAAAAAVAADASALRRIAQQNSQGHCNTRQATLIAYRLSDALRVLNDFWCNPRQCAAQGVHTYIMQCRF